MRQKSENLDIKPSPFVWLNDKQLHPSFIPPNIRMQLWKYLRILYFTIRDHFINEPLIFLQKFTYELGIVHRCDVIISHLKKEWYIRVALVNLFRKLIIFIVKNNYFKRNILLILTIFKIDSRMLSRISKFVTILELGGFGEMVNSSMS